MRAGPLLGVAAALLALVYLALPLHPAGAAFPGRNGRIAFISDRKGSTEVFTMDADGRRVHQVTHIGLDGAYEEAFSPNGKRIAFVSNKDGYRMFTIGVGGKGQQALPHPSQTAEGAAVLLTRRPPDRLSVQPRRRPRDLLDPYRRHRAPAAHSQRRFHRRRPVLLAERQADRLLQRPRRGRGDLHDASRRQPPPRQLTHNTGITDLSPSFSPNGKRIVFSSNRDGDSEIFTMRADGSHQHQLTHTENSGCQNPDFSPNGKLIAFSSNLDGDEEIFLMRADGTHRHQITHNPADDAPAWQPLPRRRHSR